MEAAAGDFSWTWYSLIEQAGKNSFHHMETAENRGLWETVKSQVSFSIVKHYKV